MRTCRFFSRLQLIIDRLLNFYVGKKDLLTCIGVSFFRNRAYKKREFNFCCFSAVLNSLML